MTIPIIIPDESLPAWQMALDAYNQAAIKPLTLAEYVNDIIVGAQTTVNVAAYEQAEMQKLIPLGQKYLAAPPSVQEQVDKALQPYA